MKNHADDKILTINLQTRLEKLDDYLAAYQPFWQPRLLAGFPDPLKELPQDWIDYYQKASVEDLHQLAVYKSNGTSLPEGLPLSLQELVKEMFDICDVPFVEASSKLMEEDDIYPRQILKLSEKKAHEYSIVGPYIKEKLDELAIHNFVDVGGGKGFLSLAVSACECRQILIDQNENLLNRGKGYFVRWKRNKSLECKALFVDSPSFLESCDLENSSLIAGLHLCGDLSVHQIKAAVETPGVSLVNIGCCYHRISPQNLNLSGMCRHALRPTELRLALSPFAYRLMDTFVNNQVKNHYRYALYALYQHYFKEVPSKAFLNNVEYPVKAEELDFFGFMGKNQSVFEPFGSLELTKKVYSESASHMATSMETYEFFRRLFSRALELYIILDRVNYLKNNGLDADLFQFFDGRLSPRNFGIVAFTGR